MKKYLLLVCLLLTVSAILSGVSAQNYAYVQPTRTPTPHMEVCGCNVI